ncbi:hypothetical protein D3C75_642160 [compost metagenome]
MCRIVMAQHTRYLQRAAAVIRIGPIEHWCKRGTFAVCDPAPCRQDILQAPVVPSLIPHLLSPNIIFLPAASVEVSDEGQLIYRGCFDHIVCDSFPGLAASGIARISVWTHPEFVLADKEILHTLCAVKSPVRPVNTQRSDCRLSFRKQQIPVHLCIVTLGFNINACIQVIRTSAQAFGLLRRAFKILPPEVQEHAVCYLLPIVLQEHRIFVI